MNEGKYRIKLLVIDMAERMRGNIYVKIMRNQKNIVFRVLWKNA